MFDNLTLAKKILSSSSEIQLHVTGEFTVAVPESFIREAIKSLN